MKNIDIILRTMAKTALESSKSPRKVQGNTHVVNQLYAVVEAATIVAYTQRHNKQAVNEILDRSTLVEKTEPEKVTAAAKTLARQRGKK